jgi:exosortase
MTAPADIPGATAAPRVRHALFGTYVLALLAAHAGTLRDVVALSSRDSTASHHVLIPLVTLVLVWQQRHAIFASPRTSAFSGSSLVAIGIGIALARSSVALNPRDELSMAVASLVVLALGGFLAFYGWTSFRAALFPLLFLCFTIPIPTAPLHVITQWLKRGSAEMVAGLFTLTGTPYHRDAFVFTLPRFAIEIADECSGIRSSLALLLTSLLAGHMFFDRGMNKALLVAAIIPVAIVKNGIRIVSLSLLAMHVDPSFLTGQLHHEGGFVFFLLALIILMPLFLLLQRADARAGKANA